MATTTRDELLAAGLEMVAARGVQAVLPEFTVREVIDRAGGPTRSAFQHAWPQRGDYEREVLEEVLASRAHAAPASLTSIPRALDLMESGPDIDQFARSAYLNADGPAQRRELRDRIAVTCLASGAGDLAGFAAQSESMRHARADDLIVQILRIAGVAFGIQPRQRFTFLDVARAVGALNDGMLMHRISRPAAVFTDVVYRDTPGWSLESVAASAFVRHMTEPITGGHLVPLARKPHPPEASRPAAVVPAPRRPPTPRSLLVDAGVDLVIERGLTCALPAFTVPELLREAGDSVTEGAFHHSWPRKIDFEQELMVELAAPDTSRYDSLFEHAVGGTALRDLTVPQLMAYAAAGPVERPFDATFMYLVTLIEAGAASDALATAMADNFGTRVRHLGGSLEALLGGLGLAPVDGLGWDQLAAMSMAVTDGMLLRLRCDPHANRPTLPVVDPVVTPTLLGYAYEALFGVLVQPA